MAFDPTNTGDMHGDVAHALSTFHEHHGEHGHEAGAFDAHGHGATAPADHAPAANPSAHGDTTAQPAATSHSFAAKHPPRASTLGKHAALVGMLHGSQATENRLEHILSNVHHGTHQSRSRLKSWADRNLGTKLDVDAALWDRTLG